MTDALRDSRASWFYDWKETQDNITAPDRVEFVPMAWGRDSVQPATLARAKSENNVLLTFNEPDLAGQANMSVEDALALWPQLQATGMRLGSPAPALDATAPGGWLERFMDGAKARGYRVDFVTVHWYGADFSTAATGQLRGYLQAVYDKYRLPIWLTEYGLIRFTSGDPVFPTPQQQVDFINTSTPVLDSLPFLERYAWYSLPVAKSGDTGLYSGGRSPTAVGEAFRSK